MIDVALFAVAFLVASPDGELRGRVWSDRGEPVAGVRITVPELNAVAWSDLSGGYVIEGVPPGSYEIRFERFAYDPLSILVTVPAERAVDLDVRLRTRFVLRPGISVVLASDVAGPSWDPPAGFRTTGLPEAGSYVIDPETFGSNPLVPEPDVLEALTVIPGIDLAEESPTQVFVRGGAADGNLVLLDGIPIYGTQHTSGVLGSIVPEAVSRLDVHAGVFPARYGGRLSSVIDVRTRDPGRDGFRIRGGATPLDVRTAVEAPLPGGMGGILVGGRRTVMDLVGGGPLTPVEFSGFEDLVVRASVKVGGGALDFLTFRADNWLSSAAGPEGEVPASGLDAHNAVRWSAGTDAVGWSRHVSEVAELQLRLWRAGSRSRVEWGSAARRRWLQSALDHYGMSGEVAWQGRSSVGRAGASVERLATGATVSGNEPSRNANDESPLVVEGSPAIVAAWLEHRWIPRGRWMVSNGLRVVHIEGHGAVLEPRLSTHYRPNDRVSFSAGYGRAHQHLHSLANEESLLNAAYAVEPQVAVGGSGLPVSRSDQLAIGMAARIAPRLAVTLEAYHRWLDDLVLVAPVTSEPFSAGDFALGEGRAAGLGAAVAWRGERLEAMAIAEWGGAERRVDGVSYHPRSERTRSLALAAAWRVAPSTTLRSAFQVAAGAPTSTLDENFEWEVFDHLSGEVEFRGTPRRAGGTVNRERLPAYVRWDIGIRKEWRYAGPGPEGTIATRLDVQNILGRRNLVGYQLAPNAEGVRTLAFRPASILIGIEWGF